MQPSGQQPSSLTQVVTGIGTQRELQAEGLPTSMTVWQVDEGPQLVGLRLAGRGTQAASLWRWLEPRLPGRTREISAAHLAAAAAGEAQEALHAVLNGEAALERLDAAGWDNLAGALAVAKSYA